VIREGFVASVGGHTDGVAVRTLFSGIPIELSLRLSYEASLVTVYVRAALSVCPRLSFSQVLPRQVRPRVYVR
jgi:hypothetical protein